MSDKPNKCDLCDEVTKDLKADNPLDSEEYQVWMCPTCRGEPWAYDD